MEAPRQPVSTIGIQVVPHECKEGTLDGNRCRIEIRKLKNASDKCEEGQEQIESICVKYESPICPREFKDIDGKCMRDAGCDTKLYDQVGLKCYEKCQAGHRRYYSNLCITTEKSCPIQFRKNGTNCILAECPIEMQESEDGLSCHNKCPKFFKQISSTQCMSTNNICPKEYEKVGNNCKITSCQYGLLLYGVCINTVCPTGYKLLPEKNLCSKCLLSTHSVCSGMAFICPMGLIQLGKGTTMRCVMICPRNYAQFGKHCYDISPTGCADKQYHFENNKCINETECPEDHEIFGNECVKKSKVTSFVINGREKEQCPPNYLEFNGECVKLTKNICPEGMLEIEGSGYCVKDCPKDFIKLGGTCVDGDGSNCEKYNQVSYNKRCYDQCPYGTKPNKLSKSCTLSNPCEKGLVYDVTRSACIQTGQCRSGYFLNPDQTLCHKKDQCDGQGLILDQFCVNSCPLDYEIDTQFCKQKVGPCPSLSLTNGTCVSECPEGHVPNNRVCMPVKVNKKNIVCGVNKQLSDCAADSLECTPKCVCKEGFIEKTEKDGGDYCVPIEVKCPYKHQLDVVFMIDGSKYMSEEMFKEVQFFIMEAATKIYSSSLDVRMAVFVYGQAEPQIILLYKTSKLCDLMKLISQITRIPSDKTISLVDAFRITRQVIFSQCNGARIGSTRQLFVMSDFEEYKDEAKKEVILEQIDFNKKEGYRMTFVSFKNDISIPTSIYKIVVQSTRELVEQQKAVFDITCKDFSCPRGYQKVDEQCKDVDECDSNMCHKSALCINEPGSFNCYCLGHLSYLGPAIGCAEKKNEECSFGRNNTLEICEAVSCQAPANCSAHNGMAFCVCPRGYTYNELIGCIDVDECKQNPCLGNNAECMNTEGSFKCQCPKGYEYNVHFGCIDIDECRNGNMCSGNGICQNLIGSYRCACHRGYEYIPDKGCIDINECEQTKDLCQGDKVICQNTPGSFRCICPNGYEYKDKGCIDINECLVNNTCPEGSLCKNKIGGFECACAKGFLYDNATNNCELDKSLNVIKPKADLIFGVDASSTMENYMVSVLDMLKNIITDYKLKSLATIKHYFALTIGGENSQVNIIYKEETDKNVLEKTDEIKYIGGKSILSIGLKASAELYEKYGQTNSSKLVIFVTATRPDTFTSEEVIAVKEQVSKIRQEAQLLIIYIGQKVESKEWLVIFKESELEEHVMAVSTEFISTIHKVIYQKTDRLIKCPDGFIFLDKVCQYKTSRARYCKWDGKLYALNSTWTSSCGVYNCTENGVIVLDTMCMGFDGDCYKENQFFPCNLNGKLNWRCKCRIMEYVEEETSHKQQKIEYIIIGFDRNATIEMTKTEDNRTCVLPFKYQDEWRYACTAFNSINRWCSWNMYYKTSQYSYCIREVKSQCIFKDKVYQEGDKWNVGCNLVTCSSGLPYVTARCPTLNGTCVPLNADNYPCKVKQDTYESCMCLQDNFGYGENTGIKGKVTQNKNNGDNNNGLLEYCEHKTTGLRYEVGNKWQQDCFELECMSDGVTKIVDRKCKSSEGDCVAPDSDVKFSCEIGGRQRDECQCVMENNELVLVHNEGGQAERKVVQKKTIVDL